MNQYILSTRLKIPQPRKNYMIRKTLFEQLKHLDDYKITLIKGGPGSGKTTLLASYIKESVPSDFVWISLDETSNQSLIFWNYIIEALAAYLGESKDMYLQNFNNTFHTNDIEILLTTLLNILDEHSTGNNGPIFLILDDFHLLNNEKLLKELDFFFSHMSASFHIILLTRESPPLYLSGYLMQGELLSLDEKLLTLSSDESFFFLKNTLALPLQDETLLYLAGKGEGWIGGLQLLAAASFGKSDAEILSSDLNNTYISEYLTNEIYDRLDEKEKYFLVAVSRLSYFNQDISDALFPGENFPVMLSNLLNKNLLIQCLDEEEGLYRCHNILSEYLNTHFVQLPAGTRKQILQIAADAFLTRGEYEEGLQLLLNIQNYPALMQQLMTLPLNVTTTAFAMKVPKDIAVSNLDFAFQKFFAHYCNYDLAGCADIYHVALPCIEQDPAYKIFTGLHILFSDNPLELDFEIISDNELNHFGLLPLTRAFVTLVRAAFLYYKDCFLGALASLDSGISYTKDKINPFMDFFNLSLRSQNYEELGYFQKSLEIHRQIVKELEKSKSLSIFYVNHYISITGVYLKQMELNKAKEMLDLCADFIKNKSGQILVAYEHNLAEYYCLSGQEEKGIPLIKHLLSLDIYRNLTVTANLVKYLWLFDEMGIAMKEQYIQTYEDTPDLQPLNSKLLYARLLNEKGQATKSLALVDDILSYARKEKVYLKITEAALCKIEFLFDHYPDGSRLIPDLYQEAIYYACYDSIRYPFYFSRQTIAKVQKKYGLLFAEKFSEKELAFHSEMINFYTAPNNTILSVREIEVLTRLAEGKINKAIGEELYISLATVKTHILNIYRKLEVSSRVAAVEKGRKLGLIR